MVPEVYSSHSTCEERIAILRNPDVFQLLGSDSNYGSYQVLGNLTVSFKATAKAATYDRSFDLTTGVHTTSFSDDDGNTYTSAVYCSYPDQVCIY